MSAILAIPHWVKFQAPLAVLFLALSMAASPADAQTANGRCTKICAQLIQAVGDEIKEQIPLDCVQTTGTCTGTGYFQTGETRVPIAVEGGLTDGSTLTLHISSGQTAFLPTDADALVMTLAPDEPYQVGRFVVAQRNPDVPFAQGGTMLTITVIAERLM